MQASEQLLRHLPRPVASLQPDDPRRVVAGQRGHLRGQRRDDGVVAAFDAALRRQQLQRLQPPQRRLRGLERHVTVTPPRRRNRRKRRNRRSSVTTRRRSVATVATVALSQLN
eukprot:gene1032-biopygen10320